MKTTEQKQSRVHQGSMNGIWIDLRRFSVSPPDDGFLDWEESSFRRDVDFRERGYLWYSYAQSSDGRWWRREQEAGSIGYRQIDLPPEPQIEQGLKVTLPVLLSRMEAGACYDFQPFWREGRLSTHSPYPFVLHEKAMTWPAYVEDDSDEARSKGRPSMKLVPGSDDPLCTEWATLAHFMAAMITKSVGDRGAFIRVVSNKDPAYASRVYREIFSALTPQETKSWAAGQFDYAVSGIIEQALQNKEVHEDLLATDGKVLVAANKYNLTWAAGISEDSSDLCSPQNWPGKNLLGFAFMYARKRIVAHIQTKARQLAMSELSDELDRKEAENGN